ncbi:hypothetical protein H5410_044085 [Solanum commersonii]|uniref:Uncharacterized protein n=1 Tax=Solanum commersonii TaxID=4109 RepID=A0A9J5XYZ4_SOLCO|nr:hypothetical protein H5410_044085 [Solanum commersonii]
MCLDNEDIYSLGSSVSRYKGHKTAWTRSMSKNQLITLSWHPMKYVLRTGSTFTRAWAVPRGLTATATSSAPIITSA